MHQQHALLLIVFKFHFSSSYNIFFGFEIFGAYLLALGIFVMLVCHHKVYALTGVFILSFYGLINQVRRVVLYSIVIANWNKKNPGSIMSTASDPSNLEALVITCLICAILGLFLIQNSMAVIMEECRFQSGYTPQQQQQMTSVAYNSPVSTIPTN